jgi:predicted Zn-dependent peptidase
MDRTIAPQYKNIKHINFVDPQYYTLDNGLQIASFKAGSQEIIKIELIFEAGTKFQSKRLVASTCNAMLREGSKHFTSEQISQELDFYGSHLSLSVEKDYAKVTLFTLSKALESGLKILTDIVYQPVFPEQKFNLYLSKQKQKFEQDLQKVKTLASHQFTKALFGNKHPYGQIAELNDFDLVRLEDLKRFYSNYYQVSNAKMIIAGQFSEAALETIKTAFSEDLNPQAAHPKLNFDIEKHTQLDYLIEKADAMQSGLRLGKVLFNRDHADFARLQVVNTVLGGYFGSRLMKNIREDKGYTYGIGSAIVSLKETGYLTIVSEVNADVSKNTLDEINKEMKILRTELMSIDELEKVKSYMLGQLLRMVDGPLALSETFLNAWLYHKDWDYFRTYMETIKQTKVEDILNLSQQYLQEDSLIKVIAGR